MLALLLYIFGTLYSSFNTEQRQDEESLGNELQQETTQHNRQKQMPPKREPKSLKS